MIDTGHAQGDKGRTVSRDVEYLDGLDHDGPEDHRPHEDAESIAYAYRAGRDRSRRNISNAPPTGSRTGADRRPRILASQ
jgi:hypothetical protein